ncbi:MAG: hypothetical protein Q9170_001132, partial [Blastenia crenularia]
MPSVRVMDVKLWTKIPVPRFGSTEKSKAEGKAVVARTWPLERTQRFSKPFPSEEKTLVTGAFLRAEG